MGHRRPQVAIRSVGRTGVAALVDGGCDAAGRFAERLAGHEGVRIHNDVTLNQVLVPFDGDARTRKVVELVPGEGTCWVSGSVWRGRAVMRVSVTNWSADFDDVDASVAAILRCLEAARATIPGPGGACA